MNYTLINAPFLVATGFLAGLAVFLRVYPTARIMWPTLGISVALTAVFDNLIVGLGIVDYDDTRISGMRIGYAPVEDFAYIIATVLLVPALWGIAGFVADRVGRR
ncbi:MAG: lycopene cyclase domain-containing protein [Microbacteriaceae bacterium]